MTSRDAHLQNISHVIRSRFKLIKIFPYNTNFKYISEIDELNEVRFGLIGRTRNLDE